MVVAVDADRIRERAADPRLAGLVDSSLAAADLVALPKLDLAAGPRIAQWLAARREVPVVHVHAGEISPDVLVGLRRTADRPAPIASRAPIAHVHETVAVPRLDPDDLGTRLDGLRGILRAKGTVDATSGPVLVQLVGRRVSIAPWDGPPMGAVTVIALDAGAVEAAARVLSGP